MIYDIRHDTTFVYAQPVSVSHQLLRLSPRESPRQKPISSHLIVEPAPLIRESRTDYFGNETTYITVQTPHERLIIRSTSRVDVQPVSTGLLDLGPTWEDVTRALAPPVDPAALQASQFAFASPYIDIDDDVEAFARETFSAGKPFLTGVMELTRTIFGNFKYEGGVTDVWTPVSDVLARRRGVCQDFAHLEIAALRSLGLPARYVSGYLLTPSR